jgi:hypothetical protein
LEIGAEAGAAGSRSFLHLAVDRFFDPYRAPETPDFQKNDPGQLLGFLLSLSLRIPVETAFEGGA